KAKPPPQYVRHTASPSWGVAVLVRQSTNQRTYLFADGVARTFKADFCERFIEPAEAPGEEDRARLARGISAEMVRDTLATTSLARSGGTATPKAIHLEIEAQIRASHGDPSPYLVYADWLQN